MKDLSCDPQSVLKGTSSITCAGPSPDCGGLTNLVPALCVYLQVFIIRAVKDVRGGRMV